MVSIRALHLCLESLEGVTQVQKKRQLLIHAKEHILDIELALDIFSEELIFEIEKQSEVTLLLLSTVHVGVATAELELFTKAELRELGQQRQALTRQLFSHLSSVEIRSIKKVSRMIRVTHLRLSAPKAQVAMLEEMLNP